MLLYIKTMIGKIVSPFGAQKFFIILSVIASTTYCSAVKCY